MNKLIAAVLLTLSLTAHAEHWELLADSVEGTRILVDFDSVDLKEYSANNWMISANMRLVERDMQMVVAINPKECITKNNGSVAIAYKNEVVTHFWTPAGSKVYDAQGMFLCRVTKMLLENSNKSAKKLYM